LLIFGSRERKAASASAGAALFSMTSRQKTVWWLALAGAGVAAALFIWIRQPPRPADASGDTATAHQRASNQTNRGANGESADPQAAFGHATTSWVNSVTSALAAIGNETNPDRQTAALLKLVEAVALADLPAAIAASAEKSERIHAEFRQLLIRRWAQKDAPAAADWINRNLSGAARDPALNSVATTWAETDSNGAEQWARQLTDPDERGGALLAIASEITRDDPVAALSLAAELPASQTRDDFLIHAASEWAGRDSKTAIDWGKQIQDESLRAQMLAAIATGFAEADPAAAATLAAQSLPPGRAQDDAVVGIVQRWTQQDPEEAAAWVVAFPEGKLRDTALEAVVKLWADKDITDAGAWVSTLSAQAGSDVAIGAYAEKLGVQFPETAAEWLQDIRDVRLRDERMVRLAELWLRQDAPAARQWISQAPLSNETKQRLLAPPPP
jgi:hypothetical protein